ncbi:exosortase/archaeosortase family protein [Candidatus Microgenomates bacterium]|nr:MAG: exosortase/archaeosortase family protein [Candidatus Microgenomates bacterium]
MDKDNPQKRKSAFAPFAKPNFQGFRGISFYLFLFLVFMLMSLPLFTTFNEVLTKIAEGTGVYRMLANYVVPFQTRVVSLVLSPFGIKGLPTLTSVFITDSFGKTTNVFFSWNCLGWQSAVLLFLTFVTGLSGSHAFVSKFETIIFGLTGTFLINVIRIAVVTVIAYYFGQLPATLIHDYGGTLFTVFWFFLFWWVSYAYILE